MQVVDATDVVASTAVNVNGIVAPCVEPVAGDVIVTTGATVSTVKFAVAEPEPAAFVAVTTTECGPCARPLYVFGLEQADAAPPSIAQVMVVGEPVVVKMTDVLVELMIAGGAVIVTVGTVVATENETDWVFALPKASVATTVIEWLPSVSPG